MQKKEYEFVHRPGASVHALNELINSYARNGWTVTDVNQDFTLFLLERDCPQPATIAPPFGAQRTPDHLRITDSFPVVDIVAAQLSSDWYSPMRPKDTREMSQRDIETL